MTGDHLTSARSGPSRRQYEICVRGHLGETMCFAFPAMHAQRRGGDTVLTGALPDQSALSKRSPVALKHMTTPPL